MQIYNYLDTVIVFVIPFTTIVVLNTFTALAVWKVAGVRRTMTMQKRQDIRFMHDDIFMNFKTYMKISFTRSPKTRNLKRNTHASISKADYVNGPVNTHSCLKRRLTFK